MTLVSRCPHCAHPLEPFVATSRTGAQAELARCAQCGGFWGAAGRLQDTFGEPARHQLVGGETQRSCVECRILMTPARLPSGATVEVCSACRGMFLDAGELAPLGVRETPPPAARPPPPPARVSPPPPPPRRARPAHTPGQPHSVADHRELPLVVVEEEPIEQPPPGTFLCVECGQARPLREGQALRDGLACRACMKARAER
ncbi:hypothetical protein D187_004223 [Cystobacter fuscus DSM 2262]|uniref:Transcription factor zinc-finger domain-containing protein n=1 Tax=Cystobacter fuscus (strain ATCC 25194 / DSM 2262 / NBRC 100088 / M29) TaxID=1242864 RepID=S9P4T2_CYSF2|nr:zf-TFIIB domain-containing protein [Cystobacter fuscus]EPX58186.1 hypothetical protein D187_004223 [Cystobacter fuscus DSM 2262]